MRAAFILLMVAGLAGCQHNGAQEKYFPLSAGHQWTYAERTERNGVEDKTETLTIDALGAENLAGQTAYHRRSSDGVHYWIASDDTGIYRRASRFDLDAVAALDAEPRYVLKQPLQAGTDWKASTVPYLLERAQEFPREIRHSKPPVPMTYTIEAIDQSVHTPAGDFQSCISVRGEASLKLFLDPVSGWKDLPLINHEWYCAGVGLVKQVRVEPVESSMVSGGTLTLELTDFH